MILKDIASILGRLSAGEMPDSNPDMLDSLAHGGFIEIMPEDEYRNHRVNASLISVFKKDLDCATYLARALKSAKEGYTKKLNSTWHQMISRQSTLDKEKNEQALLDEKISKTDAEIEQKKSAIADSENSENMIRGYVDLGSGAAKLTDKTVTMLPRVASRLYRLGSGEYEIFEAEIFGLSKAIHETLARFLNFFLLLKNAYDGNIYIMEAALQLTRFPGEIEELFRRFKKISRLLKDAKWDSYRQMPIAAGLVGMFEYSPEEAVQKIVAVQKALIKIGYSDSYSTANTSLIIVKNKADSNIDSTLQNIEATFKKMKALTRWSHTAENAPIAARLTFKGNGAVERVHEIFFELTKSEWHNSQKTAILAVVLSCGQRRAEELVIRTQHIFNSLEEIGWRRSEDYNIPAGILALLPGEPDELVESLAFIYKWLEKNNIDRNSIYLATVLLASSYITLAEGDFFQKITASGGTVEPDDKTMIDFSTFSLGWVVVADLLNNGRMYLYYGSYRDD